MKIMPFTQYLLHLTIWCIIGFNLAIFKHLNKTSSSNTTLSQMDQIKTRRRNLVSAKVGIYFLVMYLIFGLIHWSLYVVSMEFGKLSFLWVGQILRKIPIAGYRAFILRMMYGVYYSFLAPVIVVYNSSVVMSKVKKMFFSVVTLLSTSDRVQSFHAWEKLR